ncbi:unnamed protein product [Brachionus calyciflorus]|uniref:Ubiquitin-like protease family profile domain-containing protein n=1 Tax=Brachionus calyciflorus TaxID=104777 RepID=A0A814QKC3_9BILA|nr:unnamed protein product [Brachionus calyciflorus]
MNDPNNCQYTKELFRLIYPDLSAEKVYMVNVEQQEGSSDCGLFCIAYAQNLIHYQDPFKYKFNQQKMRITYNYFIRSGYLLDFECQEIKDKQKMYTCITIKL